MLNRLSRYYLFFILLAVNLSLAGQSWQELHDSLSYYYKQEQFQKGIPVARKIVEIAKTDPGESTTGYATALNNLAFFLSRAGNKTEAIDIFFQSLTLRLALLEPQHEDCFSSMQSLADIYKEMGSWKEAETVYSGYLKKLETSNQQTALYYAYTRYLRAGVYQQSGLPAAAEKDYLAIVEHEKDYRADTSFLYNTYDALVAINSDASDLARVEKIFIRFTELSKLAAGAETEIHLSALYHLAGLYSRAGEYQRSAGVMRQVMTLSKKVYGENSENHLAIVLNQASLMGKTRDTITADSIITAYLSAQKKEQGEGSTGYEASVYRAANSLVKGSLFSRAEPWLLQCINLCRTFNQPVRLAERLGTLDSVYKEMERFEQEVPLLSEIIALHEKQGILSDSASAIRLGMLARVYYLNLGDYSRALSLAEKLERYTSRAFDRNNEIYILSRQVLGNLYMKMDRIDIAERYYLEVLELAPSVWKKDSEDYAGIYKVMGQMYASAGQYRKALQMLDKALQMLEKNKSSDHSFIASLYDAIGTCKNELKDTSGTELAYARAFDHVSKVRKGNDIGFIAYATSLAMFYSNHARYVQADSMFEMVRILAGKPGDKIHPEYLSSLAQQGINLYLWGKYGAADSCIKECIKLSRRYYPDTLSWTEDILSFLGDYFRRLGDYRAAMNFWEMALQKKKIRYGEYNPLLNSNMTTLIYLYLEAGEYARAEKTISGLNRLVLGNMVDNFDVLSDTEKEQYINNKMYSLRFNNSLLLRNRDISANFLTESMNQLFILKSMVLAENRKTTEAILQSSDTAVQQLYRQWLSTRQLLSREYSKPVAARRPGLDQLEEQAEILQKDLNKKASPALRQQRTQTITVADMKEHLAHDEVAIEFVYFNVFRLGSDSTMYAAYVLRPGEKVPVFVPLCEQKSLKKLFDSAGTTATSMAGRFYRGTDLKNKNSAAALGSALYDLVWRPLEPYLKGIRKISYSPAGKLYSIAFHALPVDSSTLLMDKYELRQYTSSRQVVLRQEEKSRSGVQQIVLFGDAAFTLDSIELAKQKTKSPAVTHSTTIYAPSTRGTGGGTWVSLPGTAEEVKKIKKLFDEQQVSTSLFTQGQASEESLKALSGHSPQVLHIATHGFFLPDPDKKTGDLRPREENSYKLSEDPLLRSGLILAGGNYAWSGKTPVDGVEDGIATAYEISQLDLSHTELVVLSACETALGDIKGSEGVFGLQRAFKMAGVKKMIVSLWQVPDKETAELMTSFYGHWLKGKTIEEAFQLAQGEMRKKYTPYYWAAFVLVE